MGEGYKTRDPRLKKRESEPAPPGTSDIFPPGEEAPLPVPSSSSKRKKSRSRSRSPEGRSRRRQYDSGGAAPPKVDDDWKKTTDAFLQNLGTPGIGAQLGISPGYPPPGYA